MGTRRVAHTMNEMKGTIRSNNEKRTLPEIKLNSIGNRDFAQRFWLALTRMFWKYVHNTQVHGFVYLRGFDSGGCKRIFWSSIIAISLFIGGYILAELITQFFRVPIQVTTGNPELLLSIAYPGISLCHPQTVVNNKAKQFVDKIRMPDGYNKAEIMTMLPTALGVFMENQWGPVDNNYLTTINEVLNLNGLSILDAVQAVGINCSELVVRCSFNKKRFPCFQDDEHFTFRETMTHIGICCSFNYNPINSSFEPLRVNSYGVRGGLSIIATSFPHSNDGTSGLLFSDGYVLFMHPPLDFPSTGSSMALLEVGKITSIGIYPTIATVTEDVTAPPLQSRKCLIGSDVDLRTYRNAACATKCLTQFIYDKCECHPFFLPAMDGVQMRDCVVLDGDCFQRNYYDMKKIRCTHCLPACEDVLYKMSTGTVSYNFANTSINPMYDQTNLTTNEFTAHIYFAGSTVPVKRTIISQSFMQLLSNFGGVFNLVLGMSVLSILELFYYFCIKIPQFMQRYKKVTPRITIIHPTNKGLWMERDK